MATDRITQVAFEFDTRVVAKFDAAFTSTDGGAVVLKALDRHRLVTSSESWNEESGDVPSRPGKALDKTERDGLVNDRHDDGDCSGRLLDGANALGSRRHDDVYGQCDQLRRDPRKVRGFAFTPPRFDHDVLALEPAQFA